MPWVEGEDRPTDTGSAAQGCVRLSGGRERWEGDSSAIRWDV
jgi:hypothetical protein